ncbi:MAG: DNA primase [Methylocystaceae bacterium]|nr:MAG: DNA primase [Methylocystaceae bacterium]
MFDSPAELAQRLARDAEAVCRHYLSNGRREGRYWLVGDARNTPGRSLFVRLTGAANGKGAAGKWTDAALAEHGDLLDIIRASCRLSNFRDVADEARRFLAMPRFEPDPEAAPRRPTPASRGTPESARRLFAMAEPIRGTIAETYLRKRGVTILHETASLRFHRRCYYRRQSDGEVETLPAHIAAVTDLSGVVTGVQRTWLDPTGDDKASVDTPRRAMGRLLGNGVRFGVVDDIMAAGEGVETMLSLRCVLPTMPMVAALSANHLAALILPHTLRRLYVARDDDPAGDMAAETLTRRAAANGIDAVILSPTLDDFNDDLHYLGMDELQAALRIQVVPEDVARFMSPAESAPADRARVGVTPLRA